jgi:hypothetical protein
MSRSHVDAQVHLQIELQDLLNAAQKLSDGLSDPEKKYHLQKIPLWLAYARKAAGFFPGSRAHIIDEIECVGGWAGNELNLAIGKAGTVEDVDVEADLTLRVLFTPDSQVWVPTESFPSQGIEKGVPKPVERRNYHCFWLKASHLRPGEPQ